MADQFGRRVAYSAQTSVEVTHMYSVAISVIALACMLGGALLATLLRRALPQQHLSDGTKDVVRLGSGLIASLAALVLGLLVASASGSYDSQNSRVRQLAANVILLDLMLDQYGSEARDIRELLRHDIPSFVRRLWHQAPSQAKFYEVTTEGETIYRRLLSLQPGSDIQTAIKSRTVDIFNDTAQARLLLHVQQGNSLPMPFLVVLIFWLTIIFVTFNLFSEITPVTIVALFVFALSATGAVYLILELNQPFQGLLRIPSDILSDTLTPLGRPN